ncbi:MAG: alpha/beta fold hydrolase [bacterium]|nr:alpha/beta fold hydrolase [bacterium]
MSELMHPLAASLRLDGDEPDAFLLLHGWTGSPAHFHLAARFLNERGHAVSVPLLAGHGTTTENMMDTGWKDWVRSALEAHSELIGQHERVHVVGLSMGGLIALLMAATGDVASVTTINAPQRLHSRRVWMSRFYRGSREIHQGEPAEPPPDEAATYWVQYGESPIGTAGDLLDLMAAAKRALPRVEAPALIIQSRADETVHHSSADIIYDRLGSADKRILWLQRSRHVALLDAERDLIHQAILSQVTLSGI